jgi:hypothetical protein
VGSAEACGKIPNDKFHGLQRGWRRKVWPYAAALALLPSALYVVLLAFLSPPDPQFCLEFCVGAGGAVFLGCMELAVPDRIDRWRRGAEGERKTARRLRRLEGEGWIALHSTPTDYGDRDHILLGPSGIFLLDSKVRRGRLSVNDAGELEVDRGDDAPPERPQPLARRAKASARGLAESVRQQTSLDIPGAQGTSN